MDIAVIYDCPSYASPGGLRVHILPTLKKETLEHLVRKIYAYQTDWDMMNSLMEYI